MFFSSNKIQTARDHQIQRIEEKQQAVTSVPRLNRASQCL